MGTVTLDKCSLITNAEWLLLIDPVFEGQTRIDNDGYYYMVWSVDGILYKTHNKI